jgi:hypothetical protein
MTKLLAAVVVALALTGPALADKSALSRAEVNAAVADALLKLGWPGAVVKAEIAWDDCAEAAAVDPQTSVMAHSIAASVATSC